MLADYAKMGISRYSSIPDSLGEIGIYVWLLIVRSKEQLSLHDIEHK